MSESIRVDPEMPAAPILKKSIEVLNTGGLVVAPTETRYGIMARADLQETLEKLYRAKARDINKPTSVLVAQPGEAGRLGKMTGSAELLAEAFLPGPLTLVLEAMEAWFPPVVVGGKIGIRCSPLPLVGELVKALGAPLTATSANRAGGAELGNIDEIEKEFGDKIDLYLDAGVLAGSTSTVVDCSGEEIVILREGAISRNRIEAVLL